MSTLHLRASVENGRLVTPLPPELADTATDGTTFDIHVELPGPDEQDPPLPKPSDGPEAFLRYLESLTSLGDIVLPPNDDVPDSPRRAHGEVD
ncbi:hypothetical protein [Phycisphaera mikurensis]|uniref:Uncharacterized protein n=1 Tax=Phycisphaera mikurensis (strain NBRC 102666 / KCTC 22515 / FYK2301M01) TaxID=1142394 RepID=I0IF17_PHYMF|nr:hypothetical protein [Phycisphaera mikurensis]MBB6441647.1 hypothetical protein [Phycisphaera mikurensis]BAM03855.1 hypothetical protein PSMK_16960 [Phycisphaera mikurensis NBRC 102666]